MSLFVFENFTKAERTKFFSLLGVVFFRTKRTWLNLPIMLSTGILLAFIFSPGNTPQQKIIDGIFYGLLIMLTLFLHTLGHVISSRMVGAPTDYVLMTATVTIIQFDDTEELPSRIHVGRSLGGPIANIILGIIFFALSQKTGNHFVNLFAWANIALGAVTILPIPTLDGPVIFRELINWRK
jgi:Zn-dependent protease